MLSLLANQGQDGQPVHSQPVQSKPVEKIIFVNRLSMNWLNLSIVNRSTGLVNLPFQTIKFVEYYKVAQGRQGLSLKWLNTTFVLSFLQQQLIHSSRSHIVLKNRQRKFPHNDITEILLSSHFSVNRSTSWIHGFNCSKM